VAPFLNSDELIGKANVFVESTANTSRTVVSEELFVPALILRRTSFVPP
jgi:hypothetical protein